MKRFSLIVVIIICVVLTSCSVVTSTEKVEVYGIVTEMQYKKATVRYNLALKMPQRLPAKYLVTIINDKIKVTKKGKIKITKIGYFFDV